MDTEFKGEEEDDIRVDDDVDQKFEQKMKLLREMGLQDDRMMDKVELIKEMDANPNFKFKPKKRVRNRYQVLGRPDLDPEQLEEFHGEQQDPTGAQKFKPIEGSGLKWSLPVYRKDRSYNRQIDPQSSSSSSNQYSGQRNGYSEPVKTEIDDRNHYKRDDFKREQYKKEDYKTEDFKREDSKIENVKTDDYKREDFKTDDYKREDYKTDDYNKEDYKREDVKSDDYRREGYNQGDYKRVRTNGNRKAVPLPEFFQSNSRRTKPEEKKTETITDIDAFIRDCNKKAEKSKPEPQILDDIDDFIAKYEKRLNEITADFNKSSK